MIVRPIIRNLNQLFKWSLSHTNPLSDTDSSIKNLRNRTIAVSTAVMRPNYYSKINYICVIRLILNTFPISLAIASNFYWSGVLSYSENLSDSLIFPMADRSPTTITKNMPYPWEIRVPDNRIGDGIECASSSSLSLIPFAFIF